MFVRSLNSYLHPWFFSNLFSVYCYCFNNLRTNHLWELIVTRQWIFILIVCECVLCYVLCLPLVWILMNLDYCEGKTIVDLFMKEGLCCINGFSKNVVTFLNFLYYRVMYFKDILTTLCETIDFFCSLNM